MYKSVPHEDGRPPIAKENVEGFCIDLARAVAEKLNFEFHIQFVKDGTYGKKLENGTWNGMVGELIRHVSTTATRPTDLGRTFYLFIKVYIGSKI